MFILHSESRLAVALLSSPAKCVAAELTLYHSGVSERVTRQNILMSSWKRFMDDMMFMMTVWKEAFGELFLRPDGVMTLRGL